eukprot:SAG11_NODE_21403_length_425_cov_2.355828_1_plen_135_part_10
MRIARSTQLPKNGGLYIVGGMDAGQDRLAIRTVDSADLAFYDIAEEYQAGAKAAEDLICEKQRQADSGVALRRLRGVPGDRRTKVSFDHVVSFGASFDTVGAPDLKASSGKRFYEVKLLEFGRVGHADNMYPQFG